eukprot:763927-Hanusia_phi.AAC.5
MRRLLRGVACSKSCCPVRPSSPSGGCCSKSLTLTLSSISFFICSHRQRPCWPRASTHQHLVRDGEVGAAVSCDCSGGGRGQGAEARRLRREKEGVRKAGR